MEVDGPADALEVAGAAQFGGDGDGVGGLAAAVEADDRLEDVLVFRLVEVAAAQHLDHVGDGVLAHQHGPEDALLGLEVLRGGAPHRLLGVFLRHAFLSWPPPTHPGRTHQCNPAPRRPPPWLWKTLWTAVEDRWGSDGNAGRDPGKTVRNRYKNVIIVGGSRPSVGLVFDGWVGGPCAVGTASRKVPDEIPAKCRMRSPQSAE